MEKELDDLDAIFGAEQEMHEADGEDALNKKEKLDVVDDTKSLALQDLENNSHILKRLIKAETPLPALVTSSDSKIPEDYENLAKRVLLQYSLMPVLRYDEIYKELEELSIQSSPTPTLNILNLELEKVQAAMGRLSEIFVMVTKVCNFKKRAVDILRDSYGKFADQVDVKSTADKRKASAAYIVSDFEIDFALTESLLKASTHILKNLDSLQDNLSRRLTVMQLQMKLMDFGRMATPDYNFEKTNTELMSEITGENNGEKNDRREQRDSVRESGMFEQAPEA